jgi:hypothetical protein
LVVVVGVEIEVLVLMVLFIVNKHKTKKNIVRQIQR